MTSGSVDVVVELDDVVVCPVVAPTDAAVVVVVVLNTGAVVVVVLVEVVLSNGALPLDARTVTDDILKQESR